MVLFVPGLSQKETIRIFGIESQLDDKQYRIYKKTGKLPKHLKKYENIKLKGEKNE